MMRLLGGLIYLAITLGLTLAAFVGSAVLVGAWVGLVWRVAEIVR